MSEEHRADYAQICSCGFAYDHRDRQAHLAEIDEGDEAERGGKR